MPPTVSTDTPEAKELGLVGKVELRIALTDSDIKLESILNIYLAPLLLKLASEHLAVRNKVISVCQHINTRIKPPSIKLPVASLLKQYKDCHNPLVRHFDILYIQQGVDRLPVEERLDLLPTLIQGLAENVSESENHTANLFNLLLKLLPHLKLPPRGSDEDTSLRVRLGLTDRPQDAEFIAVWLGKLILFNKPPAGAQRCPGLSVDDCKFLNLFGKEDIWAVGVPGSLNITESKVTAAKFLASGAFVDSERFLPALFASADPNSRLSEMGDDILKRSTAISLEDRGLLERLFSIYIGARGASGSLPARAPLQTKILGFLCKSKEATTFAPQIVQIVTKGLAPGLTNLGPDPSTPKQGLEASKLRSQVFSFANWIGRYGTSKDVEVVAPTLVSNIRSYIEAQGWPRMVAEGSSKNEAELNSRSYGYESIGLLAKSCPKSLLLDPNLDLLRWLFESLSCDTSGKDIMISIEHALSTVLGVFGGELDEEIEEQLSSFLLYNMGLKVGDVNASGHTIIRSTRYTTVRFANRCLPFHSVVGRWIDVLALAGGTSERREVIEEGRKGLDPHWYRNLNPPKDVVSMDSEVSGRSRYDLPTFDGLVPAFFGNELESGHSQRQRMGSGYIAAIVFCRCVLLHQALASKHTKPVVDLNWKKNIDALVMHDSTVREKVKAYLSETYGEGKAHLTARLQEFLQAAFLGLTDESLPETDLAGDCLLELLVLSPDTASDTLADRVSELKDTILGSRHSSRLVAAHIFGLLGSRSGSDVPQLEESTKIFFAKTQTWKQAVGSQIHEVHGSILALSYWLSRKLYRAGVHEIKDITESAFVVTLFDILNTCRDKDLLEASVISIDQLCLHNALSAATIPKPPSAAILVERLTERAKAGDEKAVLALGHFAMVADRDTSADTSITSVIDVLYTIHEIRRPELQFAVGEALSCAASGWKSSSLSTALDVGSPSTPTESQPDVLHVVLEKVLTDCKSTKPALKQAAVIWLLCLVQYCGHLPEVYGQLRLCQAAFKSFLSDRESLNQETASRGLTLVYEKGDRALKDDLVRDLVGSFTGSNAGLAGNVSEETQLFEPGALPTGDNNSVTTYRDIMSLASEVGDSSLVYRFMSLASNNAIWSSRAAFGRFGLSNILSDSSVDGYLARNPKLYPALYRYRFDPNTNVRTSMNEIWAALVKDPTAIVDKYFDNIMEDLLKNILGKEWRIRQASCAAIAELIQGRPLERYEKYLNQIWTLTFKVCDDIKESVRSAAMALARVLTGVLTRGLEAGDTSASTANAMLKEVLPFLLSPSGLESSAPEVQAFALKTLLKIIKSSNGGVLRPFLPDLVGRLVGLLSSLEPQAVNYVHLKAEEYGMTAQQIDDIRLSSVRASPMMEAIERCLDMLDEASMKELQPSLESALRTTIGLPSRVGVSRVLVSLSTKHNFLFRPYANSFLKLLQRHVLDRNETISASFATAMGFLARLASNEAILQLFEYCKKLYFESEDRNRAVSAEIIHAVAKNATDRFASLASDILPFVFIAKHDSYDRAKDPFNDTWNENVGGSRAVLLYLKEIIGLALPHLESPRWSVKHTSAFAIAEAVKSAGDPISDGDAETIWPALEKALGGKTWQGKEKVLEALVMFTKHSRLLTSNEQISDQMRVCSNSFRSLFHLVLTHSPNRKSSFVKASETM